MDACKLYPWVCYSCGDYIFYSRNNYYNRVYGNFRFRGVSGMNWILVIRVISAFIFGLFLGYKIGKE